MLSRHEALGEECDAELLDQVTIACVAGDPRGARRLLWDRSSPAVPERQKMHRMLLYCIRSNALGISNCARSDLFGSGAVEKAVDLIVSRRFKGRGMSWLKPGAQGVLKLRMLRFNDQWENH